MPKFREDRVGPPTPRGAGGNQLTQRGESNDGNGGGRPMGAVTLTAGPPQPPGADGGATTPLGAPAPSPSRPGVASDGREPELAPGTMPAGPEGPVAAPEAMAEPAAETATPGMEQQQPEPGAMQGGVPGMPLAPAPLPEITLARDIRLEELDRAGPGVYTTPTAIMQKDEMGKTKVLGLTELGKQKIKEVEVKMRKRFGAYPGHDDPNSPPPPVKAGQPWFNPFSGTWGSGHED